MKEIRRGVPGSYVNAMASASHKVQLMTVVLVNERTRFGEAQVSNNKQSGYPQNVFDIAEALLRWHQLLERFPLPVNQAS